MNRRWPTVASWTLAGLTLAAIIADLVAASLSAWVNWLAATAAFAQLCIQRHSQQAITAGAAMMAILAITFYPVTDNALAPATFGGFALLVGSRGMARLRLRNQAGPRGYGVLALSSILFGPGAGLLLRASTNGLESIKPWQALPGILIAMLIGALAQLLATPGLVKVIPEKSDNEQPAVALWLMLVLWCALKLARAA